MTPSSLPELRLQTKELRRWVENRETHESAYERLRKLLSAKGAKNLLHWCTIGSHWCKTGIRWCKRLLGDPGSLGPKALCAPSPDHFREFPSLAALSQVLWFANLDAQIAKSQSQRSGITI